MNVNHSDGQVVTDGINQLADMYANQAAIYKNKNLENQFTIRITNINNLNQYTQAIHTIEQNPSIDNVNVNDMADASVKLTVTTATDLNNLASTLAQSHAFSVSPTTTSADLTLSWNTPPPTNPTPQPTSPATPNSQPQARYDAFTPVCFRFTTLRRFYLW